MTNVQNIQRPQLFKALDDYIILWSNITVKYIDTIKAVIKKVVTPTDSKESIISNSTIKPFATLNLLNYEIDVLSISIDHIEDEILEERNIFRKYKRIMPKEEIEYSVSRQERLSSELYKSLALKQRYEDARTLYV